jgi:hypothetical protein
VVRHRPRNLAGSGVAIGVPALSAARLALCDAKGLDSVTPLALVPQFLLVGSADETAAEQTLAALAAATVTDVNQPLLWQVDVARRTAPHGRQLVHFFVDGAGSGVRSSAPGRATRASARAARRMDNYRNPGA